MPVQLTLPSLRASDRPPWPGLAGLAALTLLAAAHVVQAFGYPPCELCLKQRDVYWIAAAIGGASALLLARRRTPGLERAACLMLALVFLAECGVAAYHAGVEWRWWPGPSACTGGHVRLSAHMLSAALTGARVRSAVQCDTAAFRVLGLSMAGWNIPISLGLAVASGVAAARVRVRGARSARFV